MPKLTETPNPDATVPTGMCGSPKVCEHCPSHFLCALKAGAEKKLIAARAAPAPGDHRASPDEVRWVEVQPGERGHGVVAPSDMGERPPR